MQDHETLFQDIFKDYGFGHKANAQLHHAMFLGKKEYKLQVMDSQGFDRLRYDIEGKSVGEKAYFNGFSLTVAKEMPATFLAGNISLKDLEVRLLSPPDPLMKKGPAGLYEDELAKYNRDLAVDLRKLHDISPELTYKLLALHKPKLDPELQALTAAGVAAALVSDVRRQWFPAEMGINADAAYQLLSSMNFPRAVYIDSISDQKLETGTWHMIDFSKAPSKNDTRPFISFDHEHNFPLTERLMEFNLKNIKTPEHFEGLAKVLQKGLIVEVEPVNTKDVVSGKDVPTIWMFANPPASTVTILSSEGKFLTHDQFMTEAGKLARQERKSQGVDAPQQDRGQGPATINSTRNHPRQLGPPETRRGPHIT